MRTAPDQCLYLVWLNAAHHTGARLLLFTTIVYEHLLNNSHITVTSIFTVYIIVGTYILMENSLEGEYIIGLVIKTGIAVRSDFRPLPKTNGGCCQY